MGSPKLSTPRVRVIRDGLEDLDLQTTNPDMIRWDLTRVKHKWPDMRDGLFIWKTFISWAAARRTGAIPDGFTYERWADEVLDVIILDDDDDDEAGAPFDEAPGPVSSSN